MRLSSRIGVQRATSQLGQQTTELQRTQQQISTGLRLHKPSDDPAAVRSAIVQQDKLSRLETHGDSISFVKSRVTQAHVQLREAQQLFVRARTIALEGAQETEEAGLRALADELDGILNQLVSVANSSDENGYLFSGTATRTEPFVVDRETGNVTYEGTDGSSQLFLTGDVPREALISGHNIFFAPVREATLVIGTTGLAVGQTPDTATGRKEIQIQHVATTFSAGSGVAPGSSSTGGDTVVGPLGTHSIEIIDTAGDGSAGTISLNGGGVVQFTSADTDLVVYGPQQEKIHVDMSSITPGFSGTIDIQADATMSIDGGETTQPVSFSANEEIVDPSDGSVIYVDTTNVTLADTDYLEFPGTSNAFQILTGLRDDLLNARNLDTQDQRDAVQRRIGDVERMGEHLLDELGSQSVALEQMERLATRTEDLELEQQLLYGETTGANIAEAAVRMQELLTLQQFTMSSIARIQSQNLLQFLQ